MRHLELHILQSVPVSCLNRDDLGSPKTALFGGHQRARVSSQCWKRSIREMAKELLPDRFKGNRTRLLIAPLCKILEEKGQDPTLALENAKKIANDLAKLDEDAIKKGKLQVKTLFFTTPSELELMADHFLADNKKEMTKLGKTLCLDGADIALFGRMVASDHSLTLEGAAMFSHALSTHRAENEIDFFSALDDLQPEEISGAGMTGTLEFNAATYYRFAAINLDMLADEKHLGGLDRSERQAIVETFVESIIKAMPTARKNSMNANTLPGHVLCVLRETGHPIQLVNAFEKPIYASGGVGIMQKSIEQLQKEYKTLETTWGIEGKTLCLPEDSLLQLLEGVKEHVV